jgi:hypothetical protein
LLYSLSLLFTLPALLYSLSLLFTLGGDNVLITVSRTPCVWPWVGQWTNTQVGTWYLYIFEWGPSMDEPAPTLVLWLKSWIF